VGCQTDGLGNKGRSKRILLLERAGGFKVSGPQRGRNGRRCQLRVALRSQGFVPGHDFSCPEAATEYLRALAPEGSSQNRSMYRTKTGDYSRNCQTSTVTPAKPGAFPT
jgi:hypothetical protein